MDLESSDNDSGQRFAAYVEGLVGVIGHKDRAGPLRDYCMGLLMPCERNGVEPLAAVAAPARVSAQHQSLLHFVGEGRWSDERVLAKVSEIVLPHIERHGPIEAWIVDDTGFPKKGRHSVGQHGNIAASSARKTLARSPSRCRWPTLAAACRWPIGCICRKNGLMTVLGCAKWGS